MALFCIIVNYNVKQKFTIVDKKRIEKYSRQAKKRDQSPDSGNSDCT